MWMEQDNISMATAKTDNLPRTRIGVMFTTPPSTKEPENRLAFQA